MTDFESLMRRKQRPLPKAGCSWAFYIVLLLMTLALVVLYLKYKS